MSAPVVVGLDLSLTSSGLAVPTLDTSGRWVDGATRIRTAGTKDATLGDRHGRLSRIVQQVRDHIPDDAELVVIEGPSYSSKGGSQHDRSGLWWMTINMIRTSGWAVVEVPPSCRIKYALGKGGGAEAGKDNVLAAAVKRYEHMNIVGNDVADAVLLAAMGLDQMGHPPAEVPKAHREALAKVAWPELVGFPAGLTTN